MAGLILKLNLDEMNYAKLTNKILEICINQQGVNYAGYGNIYSFNLETVNDYPVIWLYTPSGMTINSNRITAHYYLVYMDRLTNRVDDNNVENLLIENAAQKILFNIVNKINAIDGVEVENENIEFSIFEGLTEKSDSVHGGFITIDVSFENENSCIVE